MIIGLGVGLGMLAFCVAVVYTAGAVETLRERWGL